MNPPPRLFVWGALLIGAGAAVYFAPPAEEAAIAALAAPPARDSVAGGSGGVHAPRPAGDLLATRHYDENVAPIFVAPARPAVRVISNAAPLAAEPAPVQAPPIPFRVLGRVVENGVPAMFVQLNDTTIVARNGDVINQLYKVESISDQSMTVLYLPLNLSQTVNTGSTP